MKKAVISVLVLACLMTAMLFSGCSGFEKQVVFRAANGYTPTDKELNTVKNILSSRLNACGIAAYDVKVNEADSMVTVLYTPGKDKTVNEDELCDYLSSTAMLTFRPGDSYATTALDKNGKTVHQTPVGETKKVLMDGTAIESADYMFFYGDSNNEENNVVMLKMNEDGKKKFEKITSDYNGKTISIWLDDTMISSPIINAVITDGQAMISGEFSAEEAHNLAMQISSGAMPFALERVDAAIK